MLNRKTGILLAMLVVMASFAVVFGVVRFAPELLPERVSNTLFEVKSNLQSYLQAKRTPSKMVTVPVASLAPDDGTPQPIGPGGAFLRGAHWFGEGWAVNFWNSRLMDNAAKDFLTLRADGFNTVVLVIPWPGFVDTPGDGRLVPERVARLQEIIDLAGRAGLNVVLRVGYAWDSSIQLSGSWLMRLWFEEPVRQAWVEHISALWQIVEQRPHVRFAFISWEDLWAITGLGNGDAQDRLVNAERSGYRAWLERYSDLDTVRTRYGVNFSDWDKVPVPRRMEPAYGLFLDFIDHAWIERFFKPAQAVFPTMSMEVRIDSDPVWNGPGDLAYWHSHELAWDLPGAPWTTVYWSPAMGSSNEGNTLSPERAVELLEYQMKRLRAVTGNRPIFIDQFLVEDFTPGFEMNDRLAREEVGTFLELATPVLRSLTHGFALWAWRDYQHNAVPSPDFSRAEGNWDQERRDDRDGATYRLSRGQSLQRSFGINEFHAPGGPESAELCIRALADGDTADDLLIHSDNLRQRTALDVSGDGEDCVMVPVTPQTTLAMEALTDLDLANVTFSGFTQPIGIRGVDGTAKPVAQDWRKLNRALNRADPAPFTSLGDGWMGKTLSNIVSVPQGDSKLRLTMNTNLPADWPFEPQLRIESQGRLLGEVPCRDDTNHRINIPAGVLEPGNTELFLTVSRTYRPGGEQRRLGCIVSEVQINGAE